MRNELELLRDELANPRKTPTSNQQDAEGGRSGHYAPLPHPADWKLASCVDWQVHHATIRVHYAHQLHSASDDRGPWQDIGESDAQVPEGVMHCAHELRLASLNS